MTSSYIAAIPPLLVFVLLSVSLRRRKTRLPPGPKGLPLLGNVFDIPKSHEWLKYEEWSHQYDSDIIYLNAAGRDIVVVNSAQAATELFDKRSSLYSDRGHMVMLCDLVGWAWEFAFMGYGDEWREHRRTFHQHFNANATLQYRSTSTQAVRAMLANILEQPDKFMEHLRYMTGTIILSITYGIDIQPKDDPYIAIGEAALHALAMTGNAGSYLVDSVPALLYLPEWFPGGGFKRQAREWRKPTMAMVDKPFDYVKNAMNSGTAIPSIVSTELTKLDDSKDNTQQELVIRNAAGAAYAGGADTSVSSLSSFVLAMVLYPEAQRKAQEELDRVVGRGRLPEYDDEADMPYLTALLREVLRWRPVTPLAVPHKVTQDDEYKGYHIPGGAIVVGNVWAILHDPQRYPNPEPFDPDRFLTADGQLDPNVPNPEQFSFGFGRRICPGRFLSLATMWMSIASLLSVYEIQKAKDELGNEIVPSAEYTTGLLSYALPFKCVFKPRFPGSEALIRSNTKDVL